MEKSVRWEGVDEKEKKFSALSNRSRVDRMPVYSVLRISITFRARSHLLLFRK